MPAANGAKQVKRASRRRADSDDEEENDDEEFRVAMDDVEGVPIYTDGELMVRQVSEPLIVNRKLEQLFSKYSYDGETSSDTDGGYYTWKIVDLIKEHNRVTFTSAVVPGCRLSSSHVVDRARRNISNSSIGLIEKGFVDLNPEYQRDVVWDSKRSSGLIKSIMAGYFIPPIIFNVQKRDIHNFRVCVDGKQRLSSVRAFMKGEIGFDDDSVPPKKWYYCNPTVDGYVKDTNHLILPSRTKNIFRNRSFCCYEFGDLSASVEENMFQLVQRGMPLSPAEKMRALSTEWANLAKKFETDYPMIIGLNNTTRAQGFRMIVSIFAAIMEVDSPSGNGVIPGFAITPAKLTKLIKHDELLTEKLKRVFKKVFDRFQQLLDSSVVRDGSQSGRQINDNSCFGRSPETLREQGQHHVKTFSPLETLSTAILLHVHGDMRNDTMLKGDIMDMRLVFRERHKDLRLNTQCWATAWDYINNELFLRRGGEGLARKYVNGQTIKTTRKGAGEQEDEANSDDEPAAPVAPMMGASSSNSTTRQSRKRASVIDADSLFGEEDESPPPRRRRNNNDSQMDGAYDSDRSLVDVKPSVADLSVQSIIRPRKRLSLAADGHDNTRHLVKRTKPSGRN